MYTIITMDSYEQKYKDALRKLQEALAPTEDGCKISGLTRDCIENIFPELKENENEKIRKAILCYFEHYAHDIKGADAQKWIAWLKEQKTEEVKEVMFSPAIGCDIDSAARQAIKKQKVSGKDIVLAFNGAYIPVEEKTVDDIVNEYYSWVKKKGKRQHVWSEEDENFFNDAIAFFEDVKNASDHSDWLKSLKQRILDVSMEKIPNWLERQVEKPQGKTAVEAAKEEKYNDQNCVNPADKVKSKFHPGDWVIDNFGGIYQIESATEIISEHIFGYTIVGGGYFNDNNNVRLWSIADAKDGDVLVDKYNNIGIYKEIEGVYWDSYIYLGCDGVIRGFSIGGRHEQTGTHPATKEQCDLFFAKMKEAGWERIVKIKN